MVQLLLVLWGHPGEHHGNLETGVAIAGAGDDHTVAGQFLTLVGGEVHRHFGPHRDRSCRAKLDAVFAEEYLIGGQIEEGRAVGNLARGLESVWVDLTSAHSNSLKFITSGRQVNLRLPLNYGGAPRKTGSKYKEEHQVAALNSTVSHRLVQGDCHRCGRGVAVFMQIDVNLLR